MTLSCDLLQLQLPSLHLQSLDVDALSEQDDDRLQGWKAHASGVLTRLQDFLAHSDPNGLTDGEAANVVANVVPFETNEFWSSDSMGIVAQGIIAKLPSPTIDVVARVLSEHIKPRFSNTPHPKLNMSSGRKLSRPTGGPAAAQDFYEDQDWKNHPGTANLLLWCVRRLNSEDYERVWHFVIPPIMTLLDDYETSYKLKGVEVVSELLEHVPPELLKRTGVDGLLASSLRATAVHLHTPLTPELLRKSLPTLHKLIACTTPPNSKERFDQLCSLLGDSIIGSIWVYASQDSETIKATMVLLPGVLRGLGLGSVRYLKTLIPQMVHNLTPLSLQHRSVPLQLASLQALEVIVEVCRPRMSKWKGPIIEGLAKCWVSLADAGIMHDQGSMELQSALRRVAQALSKACPSVVGDEYQRLLACDERMFSGLVSADPDVR